MRTRVPPAFEMAFIRPEGPYTIQFHPADGDEWEGNIDASIGGLEMRWSVDTAEREEGGGLTLGGMTSGSQELWNDVFWFELRIDDPQPVISYWGDRVLWRQDRAA